LSIGAVDVDGVWWRQLPHGGDPLFRADPPSDGRWQRGDAVGGMYFADNEETVWAEWYRALAEFAIPPDRQMPRDLWRWQFEVDGIADLSTEDALTSLRLTPPHPTRSEWPAFQDVGERLWREGYRGVLAPSASRPSHAVLCLFREMEEIAGADPLRPPMTYRRAPAPPKGLTT
jgi:RES domain-containing protein